MASIQQTILLTDQIQIRVEDLWLYLTSEHEMLRVRVSYLGADPFEHYRMRAEIARSPEDQTLNDIQHWHVGLTSPGPDVTSRFWEFRDFPRDGNPITIRIFLRPIAGGPELMRHFSIPDWPKLTPNGETPQAQREVRAGDGALLGVKG